MAKELFDEEAETRLADYWPTGDRLGPAKAKAGKLKADREKKKAEARKRRRAEREAAKAGEVDKASKQTSARIPKSSPTGREILPGRFEKVRVDGTPSRQGERERAEILKNARRATFYVDPELLRDMKEAARKQGQGLSEAVNIALQEYLKKAGGKK